MGTERHCGLPRLRLRLRLGLGLPSPSFARSAADVLPHHGREDGAAHGVPGPRGQEAPAPPADPPADSPADPSAAPTAVGPPPPHGRPQGEEGGEARPLPQKPTRPGAERRPEQAQAEEVGIGVLGLKEGRLGGLDGRGGGGSRRQRGEGGPHLHGGEGEGEENRKPTAEAKSTLVYARMHTRVRSYNTQLLARVY